MRYFNHQIKWNDALHARCAKAQYRNTTSHERLISIENSMLTVISWLIFFAFLYKRFELMMVPILKLWHGIQWIYSFSIFHLKMTWKMLVLHDLSVKLLQTGNVWHCLVKIYGGLKGILSTKRSSMIEQRPKSSHKLGEKSQCEIRYASSWAYNGFRKGREKGEQTVLFNIEILLCHADPALWDLQANVWNSCMCRHLKAFCVYIFSLSSLDIAKYSVFSFCHNLNRHLRHTLALLLNRLVYRLHMWWHQTGNCLSPFSPHNPNNVCKSFATQQITKNNILAYFPLAKLFVVLEMLQSGDISSVSRLKCQIYVKIRLFSSLSSQPWQCSFFVCVNLQCNFKRSQKVMRLVELWLLNLTWPYYAWKLQLSHGKWKILRQQNICCKLSVF